MAVWTNVCAEIEKDLECMKNLRISKGQPTQFMRRGEISTILTLLASLPASDKQSAACTQEPIGSATAEIEHKHIMQIENINKEANTNALYSRARIQVRRYPYSNTTKDEELWCQWATRIYIPTRTTTDENGHMVQNLAVNLDMRSTLCVISSAAFRAVHREYLEELLGPMVEPEKSSVDSSHPTYDFDPAYDLDHPPDTPTISRNEEFLENRSERPFADDVPAATSSVDRQRVPELGGAWGNLDLVVPSGSTVGDGSEDGEYPPQSTGASHQPSRSASPVDLLSMGEPHVNNALNE
ncbi:hypothetical protein QFC24_006281 [Naganishia onofrii]|uniref:Uncharacterized protein n=1 Tax=Naganishia onofrii TaxID=1851511 RepID=A0ACC2X3M3_9TREE|nr:hypothetical protein QFC24_006281 [Naganishia onofrii]